MNRDSSSPLYSLFDETIQTLRLARIGINTAGKVLEKPILDSTEKEYDQRFAVKTKEAYFFIREAAERMNNGGKMVTILTSFLAAFTGFYAGVKAPTGTLHARGSEKELVARGQTIHHCRLKSFSRLSR